MSKRRQVRMAEEIKRILSQIIMEHVKDPRLDISTVSVTRVDIGSDLSHARIYISILGDEEKRKQTMGVLQKAKGFIRSELAGALRVRHAPEIEFRLDKSIEHGMRISSLLENLKKEDKAGE